MLQVELAVVDNRRGVEFFFLNITQHVCHRFNHGSKLGIKPMDSKLSVWHCDVCDLNREISRVVDSHKNLELRLVGVLGDRAVFVGGVIPHTPLPVTRLEARLIGPVVECLCINGVCGLNLLVNLTSVVVSNMLFTGASSRIVVLIDSNDVHHLLLGLKRDFSKV